jgi:hypothetical protein
VYYLQNDDRTAVQIDRSWFLAAEGSEVAGIRADNPRSVFALSQSKARMLKRTPEGMIYAVEIAPSNYHSDLLQHVQGLPSLEQIQLAGCNVVDEDLRWLDDCMQLRGIGLNDTKVTDVGIRRLAKLPRLDYMELENTATTAATRAYDATGPD